MPITLRDVGKLAGVSAMTVSRVINGREGVDAETQRKVEEAIEALDYVPNRIARGLISQKTQTIGLIVPDVVNPFFSPVVRGAETTARKAGYRVLLCNSEGDLRLEREYIEDLVSHRVEGLLLAPANDQFAPQRLSAAATRFSARSDRPRSARSRLRPDRQRQCGRRAQARRAFDRGRPSRDRASHRCRRYVDRPRAVARLQGGAGGGRHSTIAKNWCSARPSTRSAVTAPRSKCSHSIRLPTAIFTVNNMTVVGAMQAMRERGLSVPEDMALVCFDDVEHLAVLSPFLTVIDQPAETFGSLGAQLLLERISGKAGRRSRRIVLQTDLIVRTSCGSKVGVPTRHREST